MTPILPRRAREGPGRQPAKKLHHRVRVGQAKVGGRAGSGRHRRDADGPAHPPQGAKRVLIGRVVAHVQGAHPSTSNRGFSPLLCSSTRSPPRTTFLAIKLHHWLSVRRSEEHTSELQSRLH